MQCSGIGDPELLSKHNSTVKTVDNECSVVDEKMDELSVPIPDDPPGIENSNMKGGTDMIMDKTTTIVTKFSSDSEEDQTEVQNLETLKSSHSQTKWNDLRGEGREWHVEKQRLSWDVRKIIVLFPLFSIIHYYLILFYYILTFIENNFIFSLLFSRYWMILKMHVSNQVYHLVVILIQVIKKVVDIFKLINGECFQK